MNQKKETLEKEKESLNKSDAVALKGREAQLTKELEAHDKILADKKSFLAAKGSTVQRCHKPDQRGRKQKV